MSEFRHLLTEVAGKYVTLNDEQARQLEAHYDLLVRWNRKLNLTAIRTLDEAVTRHFAESLFFGAALGRLIRDRLGLENPKVADIGSGGGFPGIPLAILHPSWSVTLVESHQRKAVFLNEASRELPNVTVQSARAETLSERYNVVVARAVDPKDVLALHISSATCLLVGEGDVPRGTIVERLPWGDHRVITFHVEQ